VPSHAEDVCAAYASAQCSFPAAPDDPAQWQRQKSIRFSIESGLLRVD
jgi:hypothetical protein